jgi:hypothetical protein
MAGTGKVGDMPIPLYYEGYCLIADAVILYGRTEQGQPRTIALNELEFDEIANRVADRFISGAPPNQVQFGFAGMQTAVPQ